jgi:hypoxanthine-guanine phosphoribosyltransferase
MKIDYLGYGTREYSVTVESDKNTQQNIVCKKKTTIEEVIVAGTTLKNQARALNKQKAMPISPMSFLLIRSGVFLMPISVMP